MYRHQFESEHSNHFIDENDRNSTLESTKDDSRGGENRFRDNEELRYSLRSVWKFAPWVRKIWIVTNGQVPHWLKINHPRLEVVPHSRIFRNKKHLPSFSSPSIEANLHLIPGLSDKFLYFNDDVMLGNEVWPDDFYSPTRGQKVFLAWNVPGCADGCPDNWIHDGYCDAACNNAACGWDGGDCSQNSSSSQNTNFNSRERGYSYGNRIGYCSHGCPNTWLGDRVCDRSCNNRDCGWDAGDCGNENLLELPSFILNSTNSSIIRIPPSLKAFYIDLKQVIPEDFEVIEGERDDRSWIRTAILRKYYKTLILVIDSDYAMEQNSSAELNSAEFCLFSKNDSLFQNASFEFSFVITLESTSNLSSPSSELFDGFDNEFSDFGIDSEDGSMDDHDDDDVSFEDGDSVLELSKVIKNFDHRELMSQKVRSVEELLENVRRSVYIEGLSLSPTDERFIPGFREFVKAKDMTLNDWKFADKIREKKQRELTMDLEYQLERFVFLRKTKGRWPWENKNEVLMSWLKPFERRLFDEFADSLRFVSDLYNRYFGTMSRKVIAHMPHLIDRHIMEEMQQKWPEHWSNTSSHRFRHPHDMQYAFAYFYYLMQATEDFKIESFYQKVIDTNRDGYLSNEELTNLESVLGSSVVRQFQAQLFSCLSDKVHQDSLVVKLASIRRCPDAIETLEKAVKSKNKFKYKEGNMDNVLFYMVRNDSEAIKRRLDEVLEEKRKFVCLNDNMENPDDELLTMLKEFYLKYYPDPSPFELPKGRRNPSLYLDELKRIHLIRRRKYLALATVSIIGSIYLFSKHFFRKKLRMFFHID